jgi:protocatechuate 3,4-dioxygenase beta subunit
VFFDLNNDGVEDPNDPGLADVTINLLTSSGGAVTDASGNAVSAVTTDSNGTYIFSNLLPGNYSVSFVAPTGYLMENSDQTTWTSTVNTPGPAAVLNAPSVLAASITGVVFVDSNDDGIQDNGELGLAGVVVAALDAEGNTVGSTTTRSDGSYSIGQIAPGNYTLQFTAPSGYVMNGASNITSEPINLTYGQAFTAGVAAYTSSQPLTLTGMVWVDQAGIGVQEQGDPSLGGVTVSLETTDGEEVTDTNGNIVNPTTTDSSGNYRFPNIRPGSYKVLFHYPSGYGASGSGQTSELKTLNFPSNNNNLNGLGNGGDSGNGDGDGGNLGATGTGQISGEVYIDQNSNCQLNLGEPGVPNVYVSLYDETTGSFEYTYTSSTGILGQYSFDSLQPGTYLLTFGPVNRVRSL